MIAILAVVLAVSAEALAVYTGAEWMANSYRPGDQRAIPGAVLVVIALVAFGLPRFVDWLNLTRRVRWTVLAAVAYLVLYGTIRVQFASDLRLWDLSWVGSFLQSGDESLRNSGPTLFGTVILLVVWARAARRSDDDVELESVPRHLAIPFAAVTLILLASVTTDRTGEIARAGAAFYVVAVFALACSQLALSGATFGELRAGGSAAALLGLTAGVTVAAVIVFWIVFGIVGPVIGPPLGEAIGNILFVVLYPFAWVIDHLVRLILGGTNLQPPNLTSQLGRGNGAAAAAGDDSPSAVGQAGIYLFRFVALALALAVISLVVAYYMHRRGRANRHLDDSDSSSSGSFREDGRALLNTIFRRTPQAPKAPPLSEAQRLYLEVLERARKEGAVRAPGQTPDEFAPQLETTFRTQVMNEITTAFDEARYAGREPDARTLAELRRRWLESSG